jgi:hypothetical protein
LMYPPMVLEVGLLRSRWCPHHHTSSSPCSGATATPLRLAEARSTLLSSGTSPACCVRGRHERRPHSRRPDQAREEFRAVLVLRLPHEPFRSRTTTGSLHSRPGSARGAPDGQGWQAESAVRDLREFGRSFRSTGEGAPSMARRWTTRSGTWSARETASTNQLDFGVPVRFDLSTRRGRGDAGRWSSIAPRSPRAEPIAFLIEHFGGASHLDGAGASADSPVARSARVAGRRAAEPAGASGPRSTPVPIAHRRGCAPLPSEGAERARHRAAGSGRGVITWRRHAARLSARGAGGG